MKKMISNAVAILAVASFTAAPLSVSAQTSHRQQTKNTWRNLAIGSGVIGLLGLLKGDKFLTFAGAAGALYSANRYEQDRKSQSREQRARAAMFRKTSFVRNGHTYKRRTVYKNGHKYYQFYRAK